MVRSYENGFARAQFPKFPLPQAGEGKEMVRLVRLVQLCLAFRPRVPSFLIQPVKPCRVNAQDLVDNDRIDFAFFGQTL